jgi:hypothetical protein
MVQVQVQVATYHHRDLVMYSCVLSAWLQQPSKIGEKSDIQLFTVNGIADEDDNNQMMDTCTRGRHKHEVKKKGPRVPWEDPAQVVTGKPISSILSAASGAFQSDCGRAL